MLKLAEEQGAKSVSTREEALSALSSLDEDDQLKVIDYVKTLITLTKGNNAN